MKLQVSSYNNGILDWNAEAEETAFRSYKLNHEFNRPAEAEIVLADPTGTIAQKYNVDANDVYIGPAKVTIEDPDATDIFYGRILRAEADSEARTVTLYCRDWLDQLDEEQIIYDMREDLDGSGLRQSTLKSDPMDIVAVAPVYTSGASYYMYDYDMDWTADKFNSMYAVFTAGHAGSIKVNVGPHSATGAAVYDAETGDFSDLHEDDDKYMHIVEQDISISVDYEFHVNAGTGSLYSSGPTGGRLILTYLLKTAEADVTRNCPIYLADKDEVYTTWENIEFTEGTDTIRKQTFEIPEQLLSTFEDTDGTCGIRLVPEVGVGNDTTFDVYYMRLELDYNMSGSSSKYTISDTLAQKCKVKYAAYKDNAVYGDETTDINDADASDVTMFPGVPPVANEDAFMFGFTKPVRGIRVQMGTAGIGTWTITWKYWSGAAWTAFSGVSDGTSGFHTGGTHDVTWTQPTDWATTTVNSVADLYWIKADLTAYVNMTTKPLMTQAWGYWYDCLQVSADLDYSGAGLWEPAPYSIARPIYKHIDSAETPGVLITDGDTIVPLTCAATIEHTSGVSTRQYHDRTRLEILRDLAAQDKAVFWITLGGTTVTYKSMFNDGAPTAMTDATVLYWRSMFDYLTMFNNYRVYGIRIGDEHVFVESDNATSQAKFKATRSKTLRGVSILSRAEASDVGTALATRDGDVQQILSCGIQGMDSTYRLGTEVAVTSSYLNLTANYIVQRWMYDSTTHRTHVTMHPRVSQQGLQPIDTDRTKGQLLESTVSTTQRDIYAPDPTTHEVS